MFKRYYHNSSPAGLNSQVNQFVSDIRDALEYAGLTGLYAKTAEIEGYNYIYIYEGGENDSPTSDNQFAVYRLTDSLAYLDIYLNSQVSSIGGSSGIYNSVVATHDAIAILGGSSDLNSTSGVIITKDTDNNYVIIAHGVPGGAQSFNSPRIFARDVASEILTLSVTPTSNFGTTTLSNFPTFNPAQEGYYIDNVFIALTNTLAADGECVLNNNFYYTIAGKVYMIDVSAS